MCARSNATGYGVVDLLHMSLLLVGIIFLLINQNTRLAAIVLLPMVPLALLTGGFGRRIGKYFLAVDNALGELASRLQENVIGAQVVRAFAREGYEMERFDEANRALYDSRVRVNSE
jgi:ATP-binding cassette subfamily B protein